MALSQEVKEKLQKRIDELKKRMQYDANDLDYETVYDEACDLLSRNHIQIQSWRGIAKQLGFRLETIGPNDMETLKDAIEDAMMECQ